MPSLYILAAVAAQLLALASATSTYGSSKASKYDWVSDSLSSCFHECLSNTKDGCKSQTCICDASQSDDYLTSAVECARDKCDKKGQEINVALLAPAQMYCSALGSSVPDDVMKSAFECAMGGNVPTATHKPSTSTAKQQSESELKSTVSSTVTLTSSSDKGHTVVIMQPVAMGPSTISTGDVVTSTLDSSSSSSSTKSASSSSSSSAIAVASSNQPAQASSAGPTKGPASSTSSPTDLSSNSGGSPFANMQAAAAAQWSFPGPVVALSLVVGALMRL